MRESRCAPSAVHGFSGVAKGVTGTAKEKQETGLENIGFILVLIVPKVTPPYALEKPPTALGPQRDLLKMKLPIQDLSLK